MNDGFASVVSCFQIMCVCLLHGLPPWPSHFIRGFLTKRQRQRRREETYRQKVWEHAKCFTSAIRYRKAAYNSYFLAAVAEVSGGEEIWAQVDLPDAQGIKYRLQLNVYRFILEKYYGFVVSSMLVVCLHPDLEVPFVDEVPHMPKETCEIMALRVQDPLHVSSTGDVCGGATFGPEGCCGSN